jgi:hypothetical protein
MSEILYPTKFVIEPESIAVCKKAVNSEDTIYTGVILICGNTILKDFVLYLFCFIVP